MCQVDLFIHMNEDKFYGKNKRDYDTRVVKENFRFYPHTIYLIVDHNLCCDLFFYFFV